MPADFLSRLKKLELTVWTYARHYEIRGVLLADDLYQEGLIELDETSTLYPDLHDEVFARYFKTRLISRYRKLIRYHTQQQRDWQNTVYIFDLERFLESKQGQPVGPIAETVDYCYHLFDQLEPSPEETYERQQEISEAERFIQEVKEGLDEEAQWAFDQLLCGEVPEQLKAEFKRVPGHSSVTVIGLIFGWDRAYTWRIIKRIRARAKLVISRYKISGTTLLWSEPNGQRKRRLSTANRDQVSHL